MELKSSSLLHPIRVFVLIDGGNLYRKLRDPQIDAKNLTKFDYSGLAQWLCGNERVIVAKKYYIGVIRAEVGNQKSEEMRRKQQQLFSHLTLSGWGIERGFLMKNGTSYHEKGVDVKIAIDLVIGACRDEFDVAIVLSSDSDLVPAVAEVRSSGKRVEYIGFSTSSSIALIRNANSSRLLTKTDIFPFVTEPKHSS